ncbi:MAG: PEP-CTERM sorting domain-containing protein [Limisphaerales bacterium]
MKKLILSALCGAFGCSLSSNAAIDITVNGTEYAVTTVSFDTPGTAFPSSLVSALQSQTPFYTGLINHYATAGTFDTAYYNAVVAAGGNIQDAANVVFAYDASSGFIQGINDNATIVQGIFPNTPLNQPWNFAEVTVVSAVPEPGAYGALAGIGLLAVSLRRKLGQRIAWAIRH